MADTPNGGMELDPKYDNYDYPIVSPVALPGHPGHLTPQQQAQVHQLRMLLEAQGYTKRLDTLTLVYALALFVSFFFPPFFLSHPGSRRGHP